MTPQLAVKLNWMDNPGQTHSFTFFKNIYFFGFTDRTAWRYDRKQVEREGE